MNIGLKRLLSATAFLILGTAFCFAGGQEEVEPVVDDSGYTVVSSDEVELRWLVEGSSVKFIVQAPTTGWVAVGFDPSQGMKDANFIMGYVEDGTASVADHFGNGALSHINDKELGGSDDIIEFSGTETDGTTEINFTIPLDSGDSYDAPLRKGEEHVILIAYGPNNADNFTSKHSKRMSFPITL